MRCGKGRQDYRPREAQGADARESGLRCFRMGCDGWRRKEESGRLGGLGGRQRRELSYVPLGRVFWVRRRAQARGTKGLVT